MKEDHRATITSNQSSKTVTYDSAIEAQGGLAKFQYLQLAVLMLSNNATGYMIYNLAFLLLYPKFDCTYENGSPIPDPSDDYDKYCKPDYFCDANNGISYTIDWSSKYSLKNWMTEFDLTCASPLFISSFSMFYFLGFGSGSIFLPVLGDKYGRRRPHLASVFLVAIIMLVIAVIPASGGRSSALAISILCFPVGLAKSIMVSAGVSYMFEFSPERYSNMIGGVWNATEGCIYILFTIYYMTGHKNWLGVQYFGVFIGLIASLGILLLPESPKWLFEKKKYKEFSRVINSMAKFNGLELPYAYDAKVLSLAESAPVKDETEVSFVSSPRALNRTKMSSSVSPAVFEEKSSESISRIILGDKVILRNLILMMVLWAASSFSYYLISYQLKYLKGDIYINGLVSAFSEIVGYMVSGKQIEWTGLKPTFYFAFVLAFVGMLCLIVVPTESQIWLSLFILGSKFGISETFNAVFVANVKIFPVSILSSTFGFCNIFSRFMSVGSPYVAELKPEVISEYIYCGVCILALVCSFFLVVRPDERRESRAGSERTTDVKVLLPQEIDQTD